MTDLLEISLRYRKNQRCLLAQLCDKYGTDKGSNRQTGHPYAWHPHTYTDFYAQLFDHCRHAVRQVFECGIGTNDPAVPCSMGVNGAPGASLRVWRDYFPNARVYGADIDERTLFQEDRIQTFIVDQCDPSSIEDMWKLSGLKDLDLFIDDGLHTLSAGINLFEGSFDRLAATGIYIIEDVHLDYEEELLRYFLDRPLEVQSINLRAPGVNVYDNRLLMIRRPPG
jgi:hypothetical protein